MRTIAFVNQKGGTGKTTMVVNLAAVLASKGKRVLVIDLDAQRSATSWLGAQDGGAQMREIWQGDRPLKEFTNKTSIKGIDLVPSTIYYNGFDKVLAQETGAEHILKQKIDELPEDWDYVFIDCPAALSVTTISALAAVHYLLVPVMTHYQALEGLALLTQTFDVVKKRLNPSLSIFGIVPFRVVIRTNHALAVIENLKKHFGEKVFSATVRETIKLPEASAAKKPITQFEPKSKGAEDFIAVANEFLQRDNALKEA